MISEVGWRRLALLTPQRMNEADRLTITGGITGAGLTRPDRQGHAQSGKAGLGRRQGRRRCKLRRDARAID